MTVRTMAETATISATEFKAKCLDLLDRVGRGELPPLTITKHGIPVAVLGPPPVEPRGVESLYGLLRGTVIISEDFDLTEPIFDEPLDAEQGILHR